MKREDLKSKQNSEKKEIMKLLEKCVCKIKCNEGGNGTGFFANIVKDDWGEYYKVLMTSNYVLNQKDLSIGNKIKFSKNNEKEEYEIIIDKDRKVYTNEEYDVTIIEIKKNDGLKKESFLEIDDDIFNNDEIYEKESIYLLYYPKGKEMNFANGAIKRIYEDTIEHTCNSSEGSSGGPLINSQNYQVIGIHKGGANGENKYNLGTILKTPIEEFKIKNEENNNIIMDNKEINENINKTIEFKEGNRKFIYENGEYYIGEWLNDLRHGKGKEYWKDNTIRYEGDFVKDKREGNGKYIIFLKMVNIILVNGLMV